MRCNSCLASVWKPNVSAPVFALAVIVGFSPNSYKDVINRHVYVFLFTKMGA